MTEVTFDATKAHLFISPGQRLIPKNRKDGDPGLLLPRLHPDYVAIKKYLSQFSSTFEQEMETYLRLNSGGTRTATYAAVSQLQQTLAILRRSLSLNLADDPTVAVVISDLEPADEYGDDEERGGGDGEDFADEDLDSGSFQEG